MKKYLYKSVPIFVAVQLIFAPMNISLQAAGEARTPSVAFQPVVVAPGTVLKADGKGFAPNKLVKITANGETLGVDLYFNEIEKKADELGSVTFEGAAPETDQGPATFQFTDEEGNIATGTYTVEGSAPRRFILERNVAVTENEIQVGITGVGWTSGSKKSVRGLDPLEQPYVPQFSDLCGAAPCPEREDGLKLLLTLPRSTPVGVHKLTISEGEGSLDTTFEIPKLPENEEVAKLKPIVTYIFPPLGTVDVFSIRVKGKDWGDYKKRINVQAWLVDPDNVEKAYELKVFRNYPPCTLTIGGGKIVGGCSTSELDELSLHLEIPEGVKKELVPQKYLLHVRTENGLQAAGIFRIITTPDLSKVEKPSIVASPTNRGPVGTAFVLTGAGFRSREILSPKFGGVKLSVVGVLQADDDGRFDNVVSVVPKNLEIDKKLKPVLPGTHTIGVSGGTGNTLHAATTPYVVEEGDVDDKGKDEKGQTDKEKAEKEKQEKERLEKERKEKERIEKEKEKNQKEREKAEKEKERIEKEQKELEKKLKEKEEQERIEKDKKEKERLQKEQEELEKKLKEKEKQEKKVDEKLKKIDKKEDDLQKKEEKLKTNFCDPELSITFQPGCVPLKKADEKSPYTGKLCQPDRAITLQPGCVSQPPLEQEKLFKGKPCAADLPLVWQEGCVPQPKPVEQSPYAGKQCKEDLPIVFQPGCVPVQKPVMPLPFAGQQCREDIAITFQPGCVSAPKPTPAKPYQGKTCDPNLPLVWQEGCIQQPKPVEQPKSTVGQKCNPLVPNYSQPGCIP